MAYFTFDPLTLHKVAVSGVVGILRCDLPDPNMRPSGGAWQMDGTIVFSVAPILSNRGVLYTVSAQGGADLPDILKAVFEIEPD